MYYQVWGIYVGIGAVLVAVLGNGADGIKMENGATHNSVGSALANSANSIANNVGNGVTLLPTAGTGNSLVGNSIFDNGGLGIDLNGDGVTSNDAGDGDAGPNGLLNHPVLTDARSAEGSLTIDGSYSGIGNAAYRLDFYLSDVADPSGSGEGRTHLGFRLLAVNGGTESFSVSFPVSAVHTQVVTATATDAGQNTSEFSPAITVPTTESLRSSSTPRIIS